MNTPLFQSLLQQPLVEVTGWTLLHFVWQGILIALFVQFWITILRRAKPQFRYLVACIGIAALVLSPILTAGRLFTQIAPTQTASISTVDDARSNAGPFLLTLREPHSVTKSARETAENQPSTQEPDKSLSTATQLALVAPPWFLSALMQSCLPWIVAGWSCGVVLLSLRLLAGLWRVQQWRQAGKKLADAELVRRTKNLAGRMGIRQPFQLLQSVQASVPAVIGWLWPAVIVPTSLITGLSPQELDSLLAHELAHIRRHDYLVNLLQTVVETLLFYHPAVWWISWVARTERENCCDDMAAAVCGDRVVLAKALARMEELRCNMSGLAMSARNGSLLHRISRILLITETNSVGWWPAGLISLTSLFLGVGGLWMLVNNGNGNLSLVNAEENSSRLLSVEMRDNLPTESLGTNENDDRTAKPESERLDAKTGQSHRVMADVKLSVGEKPPVSVDLKYSNLFNYTMIPERIARELQALELGVIDFGERPAPKSADLPIQIDWQLLVPPPAGTDTEPIEKPVAAESIAEVVTVDQLVEPAGERRIVPYAEDTIWIPDHLAFYGQNRNGQTKFRVVRIERVDLGIGPTFGPVNALVIDDANTDVGVLGSNWARIPRGKNREGFVASAADGFHFLALPVPNPLNAVPIDDNEKILATHTYDLARRESTGWVEVDGVGMPIDAGVEASGVRVYVTLMQTLVAVDSLTGKTLWHLDEGKQSPNWRKISILELPEQHDGSKLVVVELEAANGELRRRFHIRTGEEIVPSPPNTPEKNPAIQILKQSGNRIELAALASSDKGRSAAELVKSLQEIFTRAGGREATGWVTDQETLVSAEQPSMLPLRPESTGGFDAQEVIFNLPEGSAIRAEFMGQNVEITQQDEVTTVVITNGRVKLFDANGVVRADASPDGGAEQLVIEYRTVNNEGQLTIRTKRLVADPDYPQPPVQVKLNLITGAPADEQQPPHRAIRFQLDTPTEVQPVGKVRMRMRWHYDLKRLANEAEQESGQSLDQILFDVSDVPNSSPLVAPLGNIPYQTMENPTAAGNDLANDLIAQVANLGDWKNSDVRFDSPGYMQVAAELLSCEPNERARLLKEIAAQGMEGQTIALCRMLFEAKTDGEFRRPGLGEPHFVGTGMEMKDWPLEPIALVGDVPLLIVEGYTLAGQPEPATAYLEWCLKNCDWTSRSFVSSMEVMAGAEHSIRHPDFWQGGLDEDEWRELGWLLKQLRPGFMISVQQQSWVTSIVPLYLLDMKTRVEPDSLVLEAKKYGWSEDVPITLLLSDNATIEWIEQIVKPMVEAGYHNFEFIRWQQSHEPTVIPELEALLQVAVVRAGMAFLELGEKQE